jgi:uncharacterized protein
VVAALDLVTGPVRYQVPRPGTGARATAELAGTGVSLTTLSPGLTRTGFADAAGTDAFDNAPDLVVGDADDVAETGVAAMVAGHRSVVPGVVNQLSAAGGRMVPRSLFLPAVNAAMDWFGGTGRLE